MQIAQLRNDHAVLQSAPCSTAGSGDRGAVVMREQRLAADGVNGDIYYRSLRAP